MTDMKLFKKGQKKRETFKVITRVDTVDPELKKKTLKRMLELKKEQERKAAARRRAVRRGLAVAAIIALVIAVTPLRGYVASAAENVVNAIHSWMEDVFHVGMKKTDNGCTVEIIEARVANDFLYLTVDTEQDLILHFGGTISDNEGNTTDLISGYTEFGKSQYIVYAPEMKQVINSYDKEYKCDLKIYAYQSSEELIDALMSQEVLNISDDRLLNEFVPCAFFNFNFEIENITSVMNSKRYEIEYYTSLIRILCKPPKRCKIKK